MHPANQPSPTHTTTEIEIYSCSPGGAHADPSLLSYYIFLLTSKGTNVSDKPALGKPEPVEAVPSSETSVPIYNAAQR